MFLIKVFISFFGFAFSSSSGNYCQPNEECWPTDDEVAIFSNSLSPVPDDDPQCLGLPTFASKTQQGNPIHNYWYPDAPEEITPYELANLRNKVADAKSYFVVIARNESDVVKSVQFATAHNIGISVFSTGHEFNDRNIGSGDNSLLIRTTCLITFQLDLVPDNRFQSTDGYIRLGSGWTWGTSKFGVVGVHELAKQNNRVVVSGHAGNVGIVGWSLGGGHGQLVGAYGMGVDQVLEVEMVIADGSMVVANANGTLVTSEDGITEHTTNADLFWALRGGGAGTWGIVTAMTIKLHKPRNSCQKTCYSQRTLIWESNFNVDDGKMAEDVIAAYLKWVSVSSKYWSSYGSTILAEDGRYGFSIEALYVGREEDEGDYWGFEEAMSNIYTNNIAYDNQRTFDTFVDKIAAQEPESVVPSWNYDMMISALLNSTTSADPQFSKMIVDNWIPRCYRGGIGKSCVAGYLFMHTLTGEEDDQNTDSAISLTFRRAKMHISALSYVNLGLDLSHEERKQFAHDVVGPEFYKFSDGSYFSESEYSLVGHWKERFWGKENYQRLLSIKRTWDPTFVFTCRHCVGDEEEPGHVDASTRPSWRRINETQPEST